MKNAKLHILPSLKVSICTLCLDNPMRAEPKSEEKKLNITQTGLSKEERSKLTPKEIYSIFSKRVKGQDKAKKSISLALSNFLREGIRDNIFIAGPSGSGKTEFVRAINDLLGIDVYIQDVTELTNAGYVGTSVDSIIPEFLSKCDMDISRVENGIIFLDELDKKRTRSVNDAQIATTMVQDSLLKLIEGKKIIVTVKEKKYEIDTSKILFIGAGAFSDLGIGEKTKTRTVGVVSSEIVSKGNDREKIISGGISPELMRRFTIITSTTRLKEEDINSFLETHPNSPLKKLKTVIQTQKIKVKIPSSLSRDLSRMAVDKALPFAEIEQKVNEIIEGIIFEGIKEIVV